MFKLHARSRRDAFGSGNDLAVVPADNVGAGGDSGQGSDYGQDSLQGPATCEARCSGCNAECEKCKDSGCRFGDCGDACGAYGRRHCANGRALGS